MEDYVHTALSLVLGALGWFVRGKFVGYDRKHDDHYRHANNADAHFTHRERDELRDAIRELIKESRVRQHQQPDGSNYP